MGLISGIKKIVSKITGKDDKKNSNNGGSSDIKLSQGAWRAPQKTPVQTPQRNDSSSLKNNKGPVNNAKEAAKQAVTLPKSTAKSSKSSSGGKSSSSSKSGASLPNSFDELAEASGITGRAAAQQSKISWKTEPQTVTRFGGVPRFKEKRPKATSSPFEANRFGVKVQKENANPEPQPGTAPKITKPEPEPIPQPEPIPNKQIRWNNKYKHIEDSIYRRPTAGEEFLRQTYNKRELEKIQSFRDFLPADVYTRNSKSPITDTIDKAVNGFSPVAEYPEMVYTDEAAKYVLTGRYALSKSRQPVRIDVPQTDNAANPLNIYLENLVLRKGYNYGKVYVTYSDGTRTLVDKNSEEYKNALISAMPQRQYDTYCYLLAKYGKKNADKYIEDNYDYLNQIALMRAQSERMHEYVNAHPYTANFFTLPTEGLGKAIEGVKLTGKAVIGNQPELSNYISTVNTSAIEQTSNEKVRNFFSQKFGKAGAEVGGFLYQTYAMYAENAAALGLQTVTGLPAMSVAFATGSTADAYLRQIENGTFGKNGSVAAAVIEGGIQGLSFRGIEKLAGGVTRLIPGKRALSRFAQAEAASILGGAGVNATQVALGKLADNVVRGNYSNYSIAYRNNLDSGMSKDEAKAAALKTEIINPIVGGAVMGGILGGVMGIPSAMNSVADFSALGIEERLKYGSYEIVEKGLTFGKETTAYKNAQKLRQSLKVTDFDLGMQTILNRIEEANTRSYVSRLGKMTGTKVSVGETDPYANAEVRQGENGNEIIISKTADEPLAKLIRHEITHIVELTAKGNYDRYGKQLRGTSVSDEIHASYDNAVERTKELYTKAGKKISNQTAESEVAADIARNFIKDGRALDRVQRLADGNLRFTDRMHSALRNLRAKMKALGGAEFVDEVTGARYSYTDIRKAEQLFEYALAETVRNNARNGGTAAKTSTKTSDMPDTKYSIRTDDNSNKYVHITENQGIFDKADEKDYKKIASDFMSRTYKNVTSASNRGTLIDNSISRPGTDVKEKFSLKRSIEEVDKYNYGELLKKKDMPVTMLTEEIPYKSAGVLDRDKLLDIAIDNVRQYTNNKNTDRESFIYVKDIDRDIIVSKKGLRHGLRRNFEDTAKVTMQIGDILENAIAVNELKPRENTEGGYVLMGIGADNKGNYYPTRIIVNDYEVSDVEPLGVVYAINAKKRTARSTPQTLPLNSVTSNSSLSTITIADFLRVVKDNFADTLSQNVLDEYGIQRPKSSLSDSVMYSLKKNPPTESDLRRAQNREDIKEYGISVNKLVKDIFDETGIQKNRRNEAAEESVRNALRTLKDGNEKAAFDELSDTFKDLYKNSVQYSDRDVEFMKAVRASSMDLSADVSDLKPEELKTLRTVIKSVTKGIAGTRKGADVEITELKKQFPEYFPESGDSPAKQIYDAYVKVRDNVVNAGQSNTLRAMTAADRIIEEYKDAQEAGKETPAERKAADIKKYGADLENDFRTLITGITEGEVRRSAQVVRKTLDGILESDEMWNDPSAAYDELVKNIDETVMNVTRGKNRTASEKQRIEIQLFQSVCDNADRTLAIQKSAAMDNVVKAAVSGDADKYRASGKAYNAAAEKSDNVRKVLSLLYTNTGQKSWLTPEMKAALANNEERFKYAPHSQRDTYYKAKEKFESSKPDDLFNNLINTEAWGDAEAAETELLVTYYQSVGNYDKAVDLYAAARERATKAGQMNAMWAFVNKLTPEGKLKAFEKDRVESIERQIERKFPNQADELKKEYEQVRSANERQKREYMQELYENNDEYRQTKDKITDREKDMLEGYRKKNEEESAYYDIKDKRMEAERDIDKLERDIKASEDGVIKENNDVRKLIKERSELEARLKELRKDEADAAERAFEAERNLQELKSEIKKLQRNLSGFERMNRDGKSERETAEYIDEFYDRLGIESISEAELDSYREAFLMIEEMDSPESLADIILRQSKARHTARGPVIRSILKKMIKDVSPENIELMKSMATQQLFGMITDAEKRSCGSVLSTVLAINQLLNPRTAIRNVLANAAFDTVETFTHNAAALGDLIISGISGERSIGFENPLRGWKTAAKRANMSYLEQGLNVNIIDRDTTITAPTRRRTFRKGVGSVAEHALGYELTVPDEFAKGMVEGRIRRGYKKLGYTDEEIDSIIREEVEYRTFQDDTLPARLLQKAKEALNVPGVGDTNGDGVHDFGLGNLITNYTIVPGNILTRAAEYSPVGTLKIVQDIYRMNKDLKGVKNITNPDVKAEARRSFIKRNQRKLLLDIMRPLTGAGLAWAGYMLKKHGIIVNASDEDEDYNKSKYDKSKGLGDMQINVSALLRMFKKVMPDGKDTVESAFYGTEPQNGDILMDLGWMQPVNSGLTIGALIAEQVGDTKYNLASKTGLEQLLSANMGSVLDSLQDLAMWSGINNIVNNIKYTDTTGEFIFAESADLALSFMPSLLNQIGNIIDKETRYPYKADGVFELAKWKLYSKLPYMPIREKVPERINLWGEKQSSTLGSTWLDVLSGMVIPGNVSLYKKNPMTDELDRLAQLNSDILPKTPYNTNNVEVDGMRFSFSLKGFEYQDFQQILGQETYKNMLLFMNSEDYKLLSDTQRVEELEKISKETMKAVQTAYALKGLGHSKSKIKEALDEHKQEYAEAAAEYVLIRQATDYIQSPGVNVEDAGVEAYTMRSYTEEEAKEAVKKNNNYIAKVKAGTYYRKETGSDGKEYKVYSRDWTEEERQKKIKEFETENEKIASGKKQKREYITGKWTDLSDEQKAQLLKNIAKYPDEITLPDDVKANKPDMSGEGYEDNSTVAEELPQQYGVFKRSLTEMFGDTDFSVDNPGAYEINGGKAAEKKSGILSDEDMKKLTVYSGSGTGSKWHYNNYRRGGRKYYYKRGYRASYRRSYRRSYGRSYAKGGRTFRSRNRLTGGGSTGRTYTASANGRFSLRNGKSRFGGSTRRFGSKGKDRFGNSGSERMFASPSRSSTRNTASV